MPSKGRIAVWKIASVAEPLLNGIIKNLPGLQRYDELIFFYGEDLRESSGGRGRCPALQSDDRVVPFGDGVPVETLDKLAWIRLGNTAHVHMDVGLYYTSSHIAARQMQNYVRRRKHAKLLPPFCELLLIAGQRWTNLCAHVCVDFF